MNKTIMRAVGMDKEVNAVEVGDCPFCGERVDVAHFRDSLSKKEFTISGLCQACQDDVFGKGGKGDDD